jgi:hypothetical protein
MVSAVARAAILQLQLTLPAQRPLQLHLTLHLTWFPLDGNVSPSTGTTSKATATAMSLHGQMQSRNLAVTAM